MKIEDRKYQEECAESFSKDLLDGKHNPIGIAPTGSGKSVILCKTIDKYVSAKPQKDVLVVSHVDTILSQNYSKLVEYYGDLTVGLYSAGLNMRKIRKVTVAGIHSIYDKKSLFSNVGLILVDECDLINSKDQGMYRTLINNLRSFWQGKKTNVVVGGLTATPFRTGQGYIYKKYPGYDPIFTKVSFDLSSYESYNKLIQDGYLVPLIPAPTNYQMDTTGIKKIAGEFSEKELSEKFNRKEITEIILKDIIKYAKTKYKKWLIFAIDVDHAKSIVKMLSELGVRSKAIYTGAPENKNKVIEQFRNGEFKALVNVNMATTGTDVPEIDLIAMLKPSASARYHVQTGGRGVRPAPWINKTHCLFLDYTKNTQTHGPINDVHVSEPNERNKNNSLVPNCKYCANCRTANALRAKECVACGTEFETKTKLGFTASSLELQKGLHQEEKKEELKDWCSVDKVLYSIHQKSGSPSSLRVTYQCGFQNFNEWITIDHGGFAGARARKWVLNRWNGDPDLSPTNLNDLWANRKSLKVPISILVNLTNKWPSIDDYVWPVEKEIKQEKLVTYKTGMLKENLKKKLLSGLEEKLELNNSSSSLEDDDIPF